MLCEECAAIGGQLDGVRLTRVTKLLRELMFHPARERQHYADVRQLSKEQRDEMATPKMASLAQASPPWSSQRFDQMTRPVAETRATAEGFRQLEKQELMMQVRMADQQEKLRMEMEKVRVELEMKAKLEQQRMEMELKLRAEQELKQRMEMEKGRVEQELKAKLEYEMRARLEQEFKLKESELRARADGYSVASSPQRGAQHDADIRREVRSL